MTQYSLSIIPLLLSCCGMIPMQYQKFVCLFDFQTCHGGSHTIKKSGHLPQIEHYGYELYQLQKNSYYLCTTFPDSKMRTSTFMKIATSSFPCGVRNRGIYCKCFEVNLKAKPKCHCKPVVYNQRKHQTWQTISHLRIAKVTVTVFTVHNNNNCNSLTTRR